MKQQTTTTILKGIGQDKKLGKSQLVQQLWSGYGGLYRCFYSSKGGERGSIIAKEIDFSGAKKHRNGRVSQASHKRKVRSYEVETNWYKKWAAKTDSLCRIPSYLSASKESGTMVLVMEDLDAAGYSRRNCTDQHCIESCIDWLAYFHACFIEERPEGLWKEGSYWHFATRQEEWHAMEEGELRSSAKAISDILKQARFQTIIHGDAKLANFCFSKEGKVAAVDFQYVGGGCGMKDLAYFMSSCYSDDENEKREERVLARYFSTLKDALNHYGKSIAFEELEKEWRSLYAIAWTDFVRFLKGWDPGHWKLNKYSEEQVVKTIKSIK